MVRLPRFLPQLALACSFVALPSPFLGSALAQDAPAGAQAQQGGGAAAQQAGEPSPELVSAVEDFWHYGKIARYDLAKERAAQVLQQAENPELVLAAFEQVTSRRDTRDNIDEWLLRWQNVPEMQDTSAQIINVLRQGHQARRQNPQFIQQHIERLNGGERAFQLAVQRLRNSGELAVPMMLDYLRDPAKADLHVSIRRALRGLGASALNPLVAATEMNDVDTLISVVGALGDIGYDAALPYLAKVATHPNTPVGVRAQAQQAITRMGGDPNNVNAADLFAELAERFYYDNAAIKADTRDPNAPANVWYWSNSRGLIRKEVPQQIFNEIMAMRAAEYAMKLGSGRDALSLWLAANYKREAELPQGATDPTRAENQPDAHYYGVTTGPAALNAALERSLRDRNFPVAYKVIRSLQQIAGQSNLLANDATGALVNAMGSSDRLVRFEAAMALAAALPQEGFSGQEQVVPLLAEALSQTGTPSVLVVVPDQAQGNQLVEQLRAAGYAAAAATSADAAVGAANSLPNVDVIVASEALGADQVDRVLENARTSARLRGATRLVITQGPGSPFATRAASDRTLLVTQANNAESLKAEIDRARSRGATLEVSPDVATQYALRSADLLSRLAMTRQQVLELGAAQQALLNALNDPRPDVVRSAGSALGYYNSEAAQGGLLTAAANEKLADDVKISLFRSLANNAKFFGNKLNDQQRDTLEQWVTSATNLDVRSAAAEARGALNLPAEQAKTLITQQSQGTMALE